MSDLDQLFSSLLADARPAAAAASGRVRAKATVTYAQDYAWKLDCFIVQIYETLCSSCGRLELTTGSIMKCSVGRGARSSLTTSTRIQNLEELSSHPHLPRRTQKIETTTMACAQCCILLLSFKDPDVETQER